MKLFIIRGLPGSGKSTLARLLAGRFYREADMYFVGDDGEYRFDMGGLSKAHAWCKNEVRSLMEKGIGNIAVSNTGIQHWEYRDYEAMAEELGYSVQVVTCEGEFGNIHGCPEDKIRRMNHAWEPYANRLRVDVIESGHSWRYAYPSASRANQNPFTLCTSHSIL